MIPMQYSVVDSIAEGLSKFRKHFTVVFPKAHSWSHSFSFFTCTRSKICSLIVRVHVSHKKTGINVLDRLLFQGHENSN